MMLFSAFGYRKKKKIFNVELREGKGKERKLIDVICIIDFIKNLLLIRRVGSINFDLAP